MSKTLMFSFCIKKLEIDSRDHVCPLLLILAAATQNVYRGILEQVKQSGSGRVGAMLTLYSKTLCLKLVWINLKITVYIIFFVYTVYG